MLFATVQTYIESLTDFSVIPDSRKSALAPLIDYLQRKQADGQPARLTFICTHNSRRSHFGQIWAQIAASYYAVAPVDCYSGGTETTACNPRTIDALSRAGLACIRLNDTDNPFYSLRYADGINPAVAFSKTFDQAPNPNQAFAAVMTCSEAEENCPFVPGAEKRISIPYEDPKIADGLAEESAVYDARCRQIAAEMMFVFYSVKHG